MDWNWKGIVWFLGCSVLGGVIGHVVGTYLVTGALW